MKHSGLLMSVLGSSLVLGGAMFTAPRVAHSAGTWYLAGQVKMALGDTNGGLQLMSRAARQREEEQNARAPKTKPSPAVQNAKACSGRSAVTPAKRTVVQNAKLAIPNAAIRPATFTPAPAAEPKLLMASMNFPGLPFEARDLPGMTREQVEKMTQAFRASERSRVESQRIEQMNLDQAQKLAAKALSQKHHVVRVIVHDSPNGSDFSYEFPQVSQQP